LTGRSGGLRHRSTDQADLGLPGEWLQAADESAGKPGTVRAPPIAVLT
jgi:hypothetical protein